METKMRVKLYDGEDKLISDRLVEQKIELTNGPKEIHEGPFTLEINCRSQEEINQIIAYLQKVSGTLPLTLKIPKSVRIAKGTVEADNNEPLEDLINGAAKRFKTQEELIKFLREQNFMFVTSDMITEGCKQLTEDITLKENHLKYQYMIRLVKLTKEPKNDKYDSRLLIGIKIYGKRYAKFQVYMFGKFYKTIVMEWDKPKKINFKKPEKLMTFPAHMDYEDRAKWRTEWRKMNNNPEHVKSKFYEKHEPFIKFF